MPRRSPLRDAIAASTRRPEPDLLPGLLEQARLTPAQISPWNFPLAIFTGQVAESPVGGWRALPGPTGEANLHAVQARPAVLCLADDDADRLAQFATVLAVGSRAVWPLQARALLERLPPLLREQISLAQDWQQPAVHFDAALQHGDAAALLDTAATLAKRPGRGQPCAACAAAFIDRWSAGCSSRYWRCP